MTLCYSVRVKSLHLVSDKAYKVRTFDGREDIIPVSQVFGPDYEVQKCQAYWIAAWILPKKDIQWSDKKQAWFDEHGNRLPDIIVETHKPTKVAAKESNEISTLKR